MASHAPSANICEFESRNAPLLVSRNTLREAIRKALHLHVGRGRRYTVKELSNATGVPDRIIECAKLEADDPDFRPLREENLASVCKFLGVPFVSIMLEPMGFGAFELADGQPPLPKMLPPNEQIVSHETTAEKRRRLIRELAALEDAE